MNTSTILLLSCLCLAVNSQDYFSDEETIEVSNSFSHFPAVGGAPRGLSSGRPRAPSRAAPPAPRRDSRPPGTREGLPEREQNNEVQLFDEQVDKVKTVNRNRGRTSVARSRPPVPARQASSTDSFPSEDRRRVDLPRRRPQSEVSSRVDTPTLASPRVRSRPTTTAAPTTRQFVPTFSLEEEQQPRAQSLGQALGDIFGRGSVTERPLLSARPTQSRRIVPAPTRPTAKPFVFLPSTDFQDVDSFQPQGLSQKHQILSFQDQRDSFQSFPATPDISQSRQGTFQGFQARIEIPQPRQVESFQSQQSRQESFQSHKPRQESFQSQQPRQESFQSFQPDLETSRPRLDTSRVRQPVQSARVPQRVPKVVDSMFDSGSLFSSDVTSPQDTGTGGVYFSYSALLES